MNLTCFKAYDIRGRVPDELNDEIAYRIGRAYAEFLQPATVVVGRDIRLSSAARRLAQLSPHHARQARRVSERPITGTRLVALLPHPPSWDCSGDRRSPYSF